MRLALIFALALSAAAPVMAEPNAQLVASVQQRLDILGFADVDARTLTTRQIAALHLELQGNAMDFGGFNRMNTRQRVKIILGWD
ncbi:hypothetical protein [Jannaschia rubra]|uniref:Uncharacterized protein n=1 Tax=Jannaschia rubra TaxID=282197 RepID=A0A0M6XN64_9RHOB|nr:hypothetical protein [Jannaschia rubra]CTQ31565.1 hypothetical protein JAN5088_00323 [Jannaschia rubra]SFF77156.1 hypothetical protein SAMN04488517_10195 [Jannaschia rubra]